jgi:hypothetical protein
MHLGFAAECHTGGAARLVRRHAAAQILFLENGEMCLDLLAELAVVAPPCEQSRNARR